MRFGEVSSFLNSTVGAKKSKNAPGLKIVSSVRFPPLPPWLALPNDVRTFK